MVRSFLIILIISLMSNIEYLAIPYTHEDNLVREYRVLVSDAVAATLVNEGRTIYAPISSWHHIAIRYKMSLDWDAWERFDRDFLKACKKLIIITLLGWKESKGVQAEIRIAKQYNIPIEYLDPTPYIEKLKVT